METLDPPSDDVMVLFSARLLDAMGDRQRTLLDPRLPVGRRARRGSQPRTRCRGKAHVAGCRSRPGRALKRHATLLDDPIALGDPVAGRGGPQVSTTGLGPG